MRNPTRPAVGNVVEKQRSGIISMASEAAGSKDPTRAAAGTRRRASPVLVMPSEEQGPKHLVSGQEPREEREQQATAPEAGATCRARGYAARGLRCLTRVSKEMSTNSAVSERGDGLGEGRSVIGGGMRVPDSNVSTTVTLVCILLPSWLSLILVSGKVQDGMSGMACCCDRREGRTMEKKGRNDNSLCTIE
jgi:hypothetical protein